MSLMGLALQGIRGDPGLQILQDSGLRPYRRIELLNDILSVLTLASCSLLGDLPLLKVYKRFKLIQIVYLL